jgi:hypothetical protein
MSSTAASIMTGSAYSLFICIFLITIPPSADPSADDLSDLYISSAYTGYNLIILQNERRRFPIPDPEEEKMVLPPRQQHQKTCPVRQAGFGIENALLKYDR